MRVGVVGHVEWVEFVAVDHVPAAGEIVWAHDSWQEVAGGGAVAAVALARLAGSAALFTALGDDDLGSRSHAQLVARGLELNAATRPVPQRRAFTFLDHDGERTITVIGERIVPHSEDALSWHELAEFDGVYFAGGDAGALRAARAARVLVATPRAGPVLSEAGVELDVLVHSGSDAGERYEPVPPPRIVVTTEGAHGGQYATAAGESGRWAAARPPGPIADSYGSGDVFAAALTFGLACGRPLAEALELAARCGAAALAGRGAYGGFERLG